MVAFNSEKAESTRGFCFRCRREIRGLLRPRAWRCSTCRHLRRERRAKDHVGLVFRKPVYPECRVELRGEQPALRVELY